MTASARVVLYSTSFCVLCEHARRLLERAGVGFTEIDLGSDPDRCCELGVLTGGRSTPQIVIDGRSIGGLEELTVLQHVGRLAEYKGTESMETASADR